MIEKTFKISELYKNKIKTESIEAIAIISLMAILVPPILFMQHWYIALIFGVLFIPFWIKSRWGVYLKQLAGLDEHVLKITDNCIIFQNGKTSYKVGLEGLETADINLKRDDVDSIRLNFSDGTVAHLCHYTKMKQLETHVIGILGRPKIQYHRWFHKT